MNSTNFPDPNSDMQFAAKPPTRWDVARAAVVADSGEERGGWFLAIVALILVPAVVAGAILLSQDASTGSLELTATPPTTTVGPAADNDETETTAEPTSPTSTNDAVAAGTATPATDGASAADSQAEDAAAPVETEVGGTTESATAARPATSDTKETSSVVAGASAVSPTTGSTAPSTSPSTSTSTAPRTASSRDIVPVPIEPTSTTRLAPTTPSTTISTTTTTAAATTVPSIEPAEFKSRIDIGALGDTFVRFRFTAKMTTSFEAILRTNRLVVSRVSGTAIGGERHDVSVDGLKPGTDYTIQVTLSGPPEAKSPAVSFRTSGGVAPPPADEAVEFTEVAVVDLDRTRFQINYASNICANGSFVIRDSAGTVVGRNAGQDSGCLRRHLAVPGFWTPALTPGKTYRITLTLEANGQGKGGGNTMSRTVTVTTLE